MTAVADKLLDDFKKLPTDEQLIVRDKLITLTQVRQGEALNRLRGSSAGKGLLDKLLADRARERARG
jgi:hypothetical protein